jgi:esterase/lipase superfamily enzyme
MLRALFFAIFVSSALVSTSISAQQVDDLIQFATNKILKNEDLDFDDTSRAYLRGDGQFQVERLRQLGQIKRIIGGNDRVVNDTWTASGRAIHEHGTSDWLLRYSSDTRKIQIIDLTTTFIGEDLAPLDLATINRETTINREIAQAAPSSLSPCSTFPSICTPPDQMPTNVEFLFATTRQKILVSGRASFSGDRMDVATGMSFGAARVQVPKEHHFGEVERPGWWSGWLNYVYETKADPDKHFIINNVTPMSLSDWSKIINTRKSDEALVFVHGFNTSFDDSLYRMAQIVYDLNYVNGVPILFSWASKGAVLQVSMDSVSLNYGYDQSSAVAAEESFIRLLKMLQTERGIKHIHILAHSMGNFLVMDALKNYASSLGSLQIDEFMMAAPDVDGYLYQNIYALEVRKIASNMTLYASSTDRALSISRQLAGGVPRAGDVPPGGPIVLPGIDSIDVTACGDDILGLNHDVFAGTRAVMDDIHALLTYSPRLPPNRRVSGVRGVPEGAIPASYWRYQP